MYLDGNAQIVKDEGNGRITKFLRRLQVPVRLPGVKRDEKDYWWPTTTWWVATIIGIGGLIITGAATGRWTNGLAAAAVKIAGQQVLAYFVPNSDDDS
jgi:hypothetical protein